MQLRALAFVLGLSVVGACGDNVHDDEGPATAARVVTTITPNPVTAGETVTATCTVLDTDGNPLEGFSPTLVLSPVDTNTVITNLSAVVTKAGHYAGQCIIPDLAGDSVGFEVVPALPAQLMIGKQPDQQVYGIGAAVTITHVVTDKYGNAIDGATVINTSTMGNGAGPIDTINPSAFAYESEGSYHVHAVVMPPTAANADVSADLDLIVNQNGPAITCGSPVDGSMLNFPEGASLTFSGTAIDTNGTMAVTVNGNAVAVAGNGAFSAPVTSRFGINFVDIQATDTYGVTTAKVCTFLAASQWSGLNSALADSIALRLEQAAIDDGARGGAINSLGDLLYTVANSAGLHSTLDSALAATNPLHDACDQSVFGVCVLSDHVVYQSSSLPGPNTNTLSLVSGGLAVTERINSPRINLNVSGKVAGISYNTSGPVTFDYIQVTAVFDLALSGNKPRMSVRPNSVSVSVGSISTDFDGVDGWIIDNILVPLAQGTLKNTVSSLVQSYISSNFNAVLDGVVSNLDISSLGTSFQVPRLDSGTVTLGFAPSFTSLSTTASRVLFGIGTKLTVTPANLYPTLGAPIQAGAVLTDPLLSGHPAGVAAHIAILNQALHALWKANYFHASLDVAALTGTDAGGATVDVDARLPPVASFNNGTVALALGDVDLALHNGADTLTLSVGIRAHTNVTLVGNALSFTGIVLDEVHLSSDAIDLTAMQQDQLQMLVSGLAQQLIDSSLNNALPSLPIPSFTLPASLAAYGLPTGAQLGITSPSLTLTPPHFILRGGFGVQ